MLFQTTTWRVTAVLLLSFVLSNCAITNNLKDGYDKGDITKGLVEDVKIYCSKPVSYIRKAKRTFLFASTGMMLPDPCPKL